MRLFSVDMYVIARNGTTLNWSRIQGGYGGHLLCTNFYKRVELEGSYITYLGTVNPSWVTNDAIYDQNNSAYNIAMLMIKMMDG